MSTFNVPAAEATLRLRDGRTMGYLEVGDGDGAPLFHFHGHGSSRLEVRLVADHAARVGVRLIGLDRPGIGRSTARPGARILDWPDDVAEVADRLGLARFAVAAVSGGGPYALACAYKIPHRLTACGLISTVPPVSFLRTAGPPGMRLVWLALERLPLWLVRPLVRRSVRQVATLREADLEEYLVGTAALLGATDQRLLDNPGLRRLFAQAVIESYHQGLQANLEEAIRLLRPWGFLPAQIAFERVFLWHGEQDRLMPAASARLLARALPHCTAAFYPGEGHLSTLANHAADILTTLSA